jgi:hypothetical protein
LIEPIITLGFGRRPLDHRIDQQLFFVVRTPPTRHSLFLLLVQQFKKKKKVTQVVLQIAEARLPGLWLCPVVFLQLRSASYRLSMFH